MRFTPETEEEFAPFVEFVTRQSCQCLLVRHEAHNDEDEDEKGANRAHCHLVIEHPCLSTFRQHFHKFMNKYYNMEPKVNKYVGNTAYSLKQCKKEEGEKPLWYICKYVNPTVLYKMNYTEKDIERFHQESDNYVSALKKQKQNENIKPPKEYKEKVKTLTFPQICAKALKEKYPKNTEYNNWNFGWKDDRLKVYNLVCDMLGDYGKVLDEIIIHRLMCGVMMIVDRDSCKPLFKKKVMDKFDDQFD